VTAFAGLEVKPGLPPMEAKLVEALPEGPGWRFEPKWDGFRCLVYRDGDSVALQSKSGKPLGRYFPEVVALIEQLEAPRFVIDGELIIPIGGVLSFDALQMRLHPAESRIRKLSAETPAQLMLFDCLEAGEGSLAARPLWERREALERLHAGEGKIPSLQLSPFTEDPAQAEAWLGAAGGALDGVVAKRRDGSV
jgi:ATP-dependent DNA ligase